MAFAVPRFAPHETGDSEGMILDDRYVDSGREKFVVKIRSPFGQCDGGGR